MEVFYLAKKKDEITIRSSAAEYLTYVASVGDQQDSIEMRYEDENIWLTQKMMATLYDVDVRTINEHIKKIYSDSELEEDSTIRNFRIVQKEGNREVARVEKYNKQYSNIELKNLTKFHDRFLIIDNNELYHIGASLKDLGNKTFAFSKLNID